MSTLPAALMQACEEALAATVRRVDPVGGGDINEAYRLHTGPGTFFLKTNRLPQSARMFETEAEGLKLLREAQALRIPEVIATGQAGADAFLLLEFIPAGSPGPSFWEDFGRRLARLHHAARPYFGLHFDNYIGSLPQLNGRFPSFCELYIENRLTPQLEAARQARLLNADDEEKMQRLCQRLPDLLPDEPPALIHGDLWNGNFLTDQTGKAVLIDPAVAYAHREMDLAMSRLFGGFHARFYQAYQESYPTAPGLDDRLEIYQLYYLLVHVNLFGAGYAGSVRRILERFG